MLAYSSALDKVSSVPSALTIIIAVVLVLVALKLFKGIAKTFFYIILAVAGVLLLTGVVDFAMIKSAGYSVWDWLLNTDAYKYAKGAATGLKDGVVSGIRESVNSTKDGIVSDFKNSVSSARSGLFGK